MRAAVLVTLVLAIGLALGRIATALWIVYGPDGRAPWDRSVSLPLDEVAPLLMPEPPAKRGQNPAVQRAVSSIVRDIRWQTSPWRFLLLAGTLVLLIALIIPATASATAHRWGDNRLRRHALWAFFAFIPLVTLGMLGFLSASGSLLRDLPFLVSFAMFHALPVHYYLRHVGGIADLSRRPTYAAYLAQTGPVHALAVVVLVVGAFVADKGWR